ncbi:hypothetical protein LPJ71_008805, partial [Coemansia sp. S17]
VCLCMARSLSRSRLLVCARDVVRTHSKYPRLCSRHFQARPTTKMVWIIFLGSLST